MGLAGVLRREQPTTATSRSRSRSRSRPATPAMASSIPAASPYVTAVGGTTLSRSSDARGFTETAWSGSGSGCSAYEPKPVLAEGDRLREAGDRRRLGGRQPEHRRRRL